MPCLSKFIMIEPKRIGNSIELNCIAYLYDCGCEILLPYGDSQKYDIVIQYNGVFYKIQCKSAVPSYTENGDISSIHFKTTWESGRQKRERMRYTKDDVDFFATFFDGICYLVPVEETCSQQKCLRFLSPKNGQVKGISFADQYIGKDILERL